MKGNKPALHTALSPSMLHLYDADNTIVVIIDVLRATSTIATALYNGASYVIPVDSVARCIELGSMPDTVTAGERDGRIAEGLQHGNSPFEYSRAFIENKVLVLTTTNGTRLLYMALEKGAKNIITGSFPNLSAVTDHLIVQKQNVLLACAAWKDRVNIEDTLFAGAVIAGVKEHFDINCDASMMAHALYTEAKPDVYGFVKNKKASHYLRLSGYGLEKDIHYCFTPDIANILPVYKEGKLVAGTGSAACSKAGLAAS
ncbi:2-phosphosulfolactate phosphatase [Agriterribacter sp.]|uniref:2-phosphosulfolactate phosphatase n=1 Tax=Agriterribacter sp. TaxID=2821509 RepID=UPI002BBC1259|nr:2-phosphosulfolactate phosphatase [Agriterribacter sp.]HRO48042.1 2-phosphosulfolactate phosphatase [Agriterribacter sp.]HRQ18135.1 2-phosphosulfolactate phosphatase [Agriterribacter sp.]